jgi:hypothetical protein
MVKRTNANLLHAQGITGRGVTYSVSRYRLVEPARDQTNVAGQNVVLQGYDAIGNTLGVGAPSDSCGHGTHVLSIAINSSVAEDGTFIGMAPNAARIIVGRFTGTRRYLRRHNSRN